MAIDYAERARALVGTRFRPQGRDESGLDCVGVIVATFGSPAGRVRRNYRLRGNHFAELKREMGALFRAVPRRQVRCGDVLLMKVPNDQAHLGVRTAKGFVHAHAGIGRVVETPGIPEWPIIAVYRKRSR